MQKVPIWLQSLTDPITSVYLSCALLKMFIHLLLIFILSTLISGTKNIVDKRFLIAAALLVPLIQANGYWGHMGFNDRATTYVFFYSLPVVLLMFFLMPVYQMIFTQEETKRSLFKSALLIIPAIILPLSGPLVPGVSLIISGLIVIYYLRKFHHEENSNLISKFRKIPSPIFIYIIPICIVSLYSVFLGKFDSNYASETIPISERYMMLPLGIYYQISQSLGVPLLLLIIGTNVYLINAHFKTPEGQKIVSSLKWIGIFAAVYLLLLPLGGYRPYRPNILRYDTFIPITITLLYFYGMSTYFLLRNMKSRKLNGYLILLFAIFAIYMNSDRIKTKEYRFERKCLEILAKSPDEITKLPAAFNVMSWEPITNPRSSEGNAIILQFWGITKDKKLYYQSSAQN